MGLFPEYFIQQVLQATDIVDLVGRYVALQQKGREFVGLCPFHDDHKPSMRVSPAKQIYKCFSCGAGGNSLQFVMNFEKLTFPEAVRSLAGQANIPLPTDTEAVPQQRGMSKNDLAGAVEVAAKFYQQQLYEPAGAAALKYVRSRGLSEESIERFGLGYAPESWDSIARIGRQSGYNEEQLVAAGLVKRRESGGCFDYFRNRLIFPIHDQTGRVVAFGGRALAADEKAKYLNSPESALFDKSSLVYGLQFAREAIVKSTRAVVVEGYFDVLLPIQAGVANVVATLGTALTDRHVRLLGRYAREVVLLFDADVAGAAAAERALQLFLSQRMHVRVATIPAGKDPCDFALAAGGPALQELIDQAPDAMQYVWDQRYAAYQAAGGNPAERNRVIEDFLTFIVASGSYGAIDETRRAGLAQHIAHIVNVPAIDLQQQMKRLGRRRPPAHPAAQETSLNPAQVGAVVGIPAGAAGNPERNILEILLDQPELFDDAAERIDPEHFNDAILRAIAHRVWDKGHQGQLSLENLLAMEELAGLAPVLTELSIAGQQRGQHAETLAEAVTKILDRHDKADLESMKRSELDDDQLRQLQERFRKTDPTKRPKIR